MVLCRAFVEVIKPATPHRLGHYDVQVMGQDLHDYVRTYRIQAKSDDAAAREGIDKFVNEINEIIGAE